MASLSLKHIYKVYDGGVKAVNDFSMEIEDKEFIVFVGPSGCGKSTTLRMIAGLEDITAGELRIDNVVVNDFEPKERNIAMVFQNYALYPHMSVYDNMAFSLRTMHIPNEEIHAKVIEAARILGITEYLERKPKALSGGQRQRVALGRAIVRNPKVFLLDEPLSNLDAKLRSAMRAEISRLHERLQTTFIYVTHDQVEAMTMGTRIVVMKSGYIQQIDTPINLYKYPDNMFVAGFIGTPQMNFFDATVKKEGKNVRFNFNCGTEINMSYTQADKILVKYMDGEHPVVFGIRPDDVKIYNSSLDAEFWARARAVVSVVEVLGGETLIYANLNLETPDAQSGAIIIKAEPDTMVRRGDIVDIAISKRKFHVFDKETEQSIRRRIPDENIIGVSVIDRNICFEGQRFALPSAVVTSDAREAELVIPTDAVKIGVGAGKASVQWIEQIDAKTLYFLNIGELTVFSLAYGEPKYNIGDEVSFDIDMSRIQISACNVEPLNRTNVLAGTFIKEKEECDGKKCYNFYMSFAGHRVPAPRKISEKLFACKGTKIFRTPLEYIFDASAVKLSSNIEGAVLWGEAYELLDYGERKFAKIKIGDSTIIAESDVAVGEKVAIELDEAMISIKDSELDIIIV